MARKLLALCRLPLAKYHQAPIPPGKEFCLAKRGARVYLLGDGLDSYSFRSSGRKALTFLDAAAIMTNRDFSYVI
jgi:hypothetical protein